jgi:YVTN family beta-propeller protein
MQISVQDSEMTMTRAIACLATLAVLSMPALAQTSKPRVLLVLSKGDLTLSVVDPATVTVLGRVPSGPDPHEVVASDDGRTAYIANYNGGVNRITVVDLVTMKARPSIDLGPLRAPHGLAFVGGKLWFTAEGAKAIGRYDPATSKVDWVLGTGQDRTHMIDVSHDERRIVTTNVSSATITIAERGAGGRGGPAGRGAPADWEETVVPVGRGSEGFDVTPDGKQIWVANATDGTVSIVDVASKTVTTTLAADVGGANRLKFTPDGTRALVTTVSGPDLVVLDTSTHKTVSRIPIGHGAAGLEISADGQHAYASCTPDNYVAVIDLKTLTMTGRIAAGAGPDGITWAARP